MESAEQIGVKLEWLIRQANNTPIGEKQEKLKNRIMDYAIKYKYLSGEWYQYKGAIKWLTKNL